MITVYGIKTCGSVRNALKFFKDNNIEVEFLISKKRIQMLLKSNLGHKKLI